VLADEGGPVFFGGCTRNARPGPRDRAARRGVPRWWGCVPVTYSAILDGWPASPPAGFNNLLLQEWLPAMPEVEAALERGCTVADIGCGQGRHWSNSPTDSRIPLRRIRPPQPSIDAARAHAAANRVADRVRFELHDATAGLRTVTT